MKTNNTNNQFNKLSFFKKSNIDKYLASLDLNLISKDGISNLSKINHLLAKKNLGNNYFPLQLDDEIHNIYVPSGVWVSGAPLLWLQGYKGDSVTVGVIDTGIDPKHNDLKNVNKRISFVGDDEYTKIHYHGTHVAGTIGANGNIRGVAPHVTLNDYRVFDYLGNTEIGVIEKAIIKATDDGCNILNLSLGGPIDNDSLKKAINYANEKNVLCVVAAGNESSNVDWEENVISYPANYPTVMSVACVDYNTQLGRVTISDTKFSNRNSEVDVCSDGFQVVSTIPSKNGEDRYGVLTGTSMSCPHVAGFAALMLGKTNYLTKNTGHSICDLYSIVKSQTVPINVGNLEKKDGIIDNVTGAGYVTAYPEIPTRYMKNKLLFHIENLNLFAPTPEKKSKKRNGW